MCYSLFNTINLHCFWLKSEFTVFTFIVSQFYGSKLHTWNHFSKLAEQLKEQVHRFFRSVLKPSCVHVSIKTGFACWSFIWAFGAFKYTSAQNKGYRVDTGSPSFTLKRLEVVISLWPVWTAGIVKLSNQFHRYAHSTNLLNERLENCEPAL